MTFYWPEHMLQDGQRRIDQDLIRLLIPMAKVNDFAFFRLNILRVPGRWQKPFLSLRKITTLKA